jgi:hypothetical protein
LDGARSVSTFIQFPHDKARALRITTGHSAMQVLVCAILTVGRRMKAASILLCTVSLTGTACGNCTVLAERVAPSSTTIRVGQRVTLRRERGGTCGYPVSPVMTSWYTSDTLVVSLDTTSGVVIGRSPGTARVTAGDSGIESVIQVQP